MAPGRHQFRSQRVPLERAVDLIFDDSGEVIAASSVNVSDTGMLVRSERPRAPGSPIRFQFEPWLTGMGDVIWTREEDDGTTLLGISLKRHRRDVLFRLLEDYRA